MEGAITKTVRDTTSSRATNVERSTTIVDAAKLRKQHVGSPPVAGGEHVLGVETDGRIATRVVAGGRNPGSTSVGEIASTDVVAIDPQQASMRRCA